MTTKLPTKAGVKFILAEDIRAEGQGRFSLLGVFPADRFAVGGTVPPGFENAAFVLPSLAFLLLISGGEGTFSARFKIIAPDRKTILNDVPLAPVTVQAHLPSVVANVAKPFVGPAFGVYTIQLEIDKAKFKFPVHIEQASAESVAQAFGAVRPARMKGALVRKPKRKAAG